MSCRILLVDDDKSFTEQIASLLAPEGYFVFREHDSSKVTELLNQNEYELVLLDIQMPKPDGLTLLKKILARVECSYEIKERIRERIAEAKRAGNPRESFRTFLQRAIETAHALDKDLLQEYLLRAVNDRGREEQIAGFMLPEKWQLLREVAVDLGCSLRQAGIAAMLYLEDFEDGKVCA